MTVIYKVILIVILLIGLYLFQNCLSPKQEAFTNNKECPNILVQDGKHIILYNSRVAKIPGVNPIKFKNLEEYVEFLKWQRYEGIDCPILFLQHSYDIQGNSVYKNRPDPTDLHGGLPSVAPLMNNDIIQSKLLDAGHDDPPYNKNLYPGFDPQNQYIGLETPLDKMFHQDIGSVSPNAMDPNWGGVKYTQKLVDEGVYKEDNVKIYVPD